MFIDGSVEMAFGFSEKEAVSNLVTRDRILRRVAEEQRVMIDWEREIKMGEKRLMQKK